MSRLDLQEHTFFSSSMDFKTQSNGESPRASSNKGAEPTQRAYVAAGTTTTNTSFNNDHSYRK